MFMVNLMGVRKKIGDKEVSEGTNNLLYIMHIVQFAELFCGAIS